jgi:hypothetical protein
MDLRAALIERFDAMVTASEVTKLIDKHLTKCMDDVIGDALRSYSDFGKQLKEVVAKSFAINGQLSLPEYNHAIIAIIQKQVEAHVNDSIEKQIAANMAELLETPPTEIKLSKLIEEFKQECGGRLDGGESGEITFFRDDAQGGYCHIYLDEDKGKSKYSCDVHIDVTKEGEVYCVKLGGQEVKKKLFVGPLYGFGKSLFQMAAAKTKIVLDVQPDDISLVYGYDPD